MADEIQIQPSSSSEILDLLLGAGLDLLLGAGLDLRPLALWEVSHQGGRLTSVQARTKHEAFAPAFRKAKKFIQFSYSR